MLEETMCMWHGNGSGSWPLETFIVTRVSSVDMRTLDLYTKSASTNAQLFYLCVSNTVQFSAEILGVEIASSYVLRWVSVMWSHSWFFTVPVGIFFCQGYNNFDFHLLEITVRNQPSTCHNFETISHSNGAGIHEVWPAFLAWFQSGVKCNSSTLPLCK